MRYNDKMNITYIAAWNIRTVPLPRKLAPGSAIITKVRNPIPLGYAGFYTLYSWMILTLIL
jgi:hypothetical protein